jgi:hypothetical protein
MRQTRLTNPSISSIHFHSILFDIVFKLHLNSGIIGNA